MVVEDIRKLMEGTIGRLTPTKAQELARSIEGAVVLKHLVKPAQLANRPAAVGAGTDEAGELWRERAVRWVGGMLFGRIGRGE